MKSPEQPERPVPHEESGEKFRQMKYKISEDPIHLLPDQIDPTLPPTGSMDAFDRWQRAKEAEDDRRIDDKSAA